MILVLGNRQNFIKLQELIITPEEGWKLLTVTMDGTDITAQIGNDGIDERLERFRVVASDYREIDGTLTGGVVMTPPVSYSLYLSVFQGGQRCM